MPYLAGLIEEKSEEWAYVTEEGVWALCRGLDEKMKGGVAAKYMGVHPSGIPRRYCGLTQVRGEGLPQLSKRDLKSDQE